MIEKNINSRIQHKHDIEANWAKALNFIPKAGEIIIYDIDENNSVPRVKIGDGETNVNDLVFAVEEGFSGSWYDLIDRPIVTTEISGESETVTVSASESIIS